MILLGFTTEEKNVTHVGIICATAHIRVTRGLLGVDMGVLLSGVYRTKVAAFLVGPHV